MVDEYTRECLGIEVARKLNSQDVLRVLARLFVGNGTPEYIRSDNGPELTAKVLVEQWRKEYNQIRPHSSLGYRPSFMTLPAIGK